MARYLIAVLCAGLICTAVFPLQASAASADQPGFSCARTGDSIVVHFGINKRPTNFGVETPTGRFLYVVVPAKGIDHLGSAYKRDTLMLGLEDTIGTRLGHDDRNEDEKVFADPGQYTLRFQDANRAEYEDLYALSCTIEIPPRVAAIGRPNGHTACNATGKDSTAWIADESLLSSAAKEIVGCQATSGCGANGCCTRNFPGQPCYCNFCCLAKPAITGPRIATNDTTNEK